MTNEEKMEKVIQWVDPEERVTVQFLDVQDLNAEVTGCSDQSVDLAIETHVPHIKQRISLPLTQLEVADDPTHYTRDPDRPLKRRRLMLVVNEKRPAIIY